MTAATRSPTPIDELVEAARAALKNDPHMTVYTMNPDGTENRRPVNPLLAMFRSISTSMTAAAEAFGELGGVMAEVGARFATLRDSVQDAVFDTTPPSPYTLDSILTLRNGGPDAWRRL